MKDGFTITNKEKMPWTPMIPPTRDIKVTKEWKDIKGNVLESPAEKIEVELYKDGVATGKKVELTKANNWTATFEKLEVADKLGSTNYYQYTVKEVGENGSAIQLNNKWYGVSYAGTMKDGLTITNKEKMPWTPMEIPTRDLKVTKTWDLLERHTIPVNEIEVELFKDNVSTGKKLTLNEANNWKHTFEDLYEFYTVEGEDPVIYEYYVKEDPVAGYNTVITGDHKDGFTITNTNTTDLIDIPVEKKWDGDTVDSAKVTLLANGEEVETVELNEANSWKHVFTGLQKYNNDGSEVAYTVKEVGETASVIELDGKKFDVEYTGNTTDGFTVTNKKPIDPPTPTPTPTPKTSDNSHVMSYALLTLLSAFFVVIVASKRIKYSN